MSKTKKTEKFVRCVAKKNFIEANDILKAIIQDKVDERVEEVLSTQSKK